MIHTCKGKEREKKGNILQEFKLDVLVFAEENKNIYFCETRDKGCIDFAIIMVYWLTLASLIVRRLLRYYHYQ